MRVVKDVVPLVCVKTFTPGKPAPTTNKKGEDMDNISKALTWNDLADLYDGERHRRRPARTLRMETVFNWAARQKERFCVAPESTIHIMLDIAKQETEA